MAGDAPRPTAAAFLAENARFDTFAAIVAQAELDGLLRRAGMVTVFAPTDEAFEHVPEDALQALRTDAEAARSFVWLHLIVDDIISMPNGLLVANGSVNPVARVVGLPEDIP